MNKNIYSIIVLCLLLVGMQYINAWTGPATSPAPTNPPNNNVAAPLNIGSTAQVKDGGLGVTNFVADSAIVTGSIQTNTSVWSPQYCDENGANCMTSSGAGGTSTVTIGGVCFEPAYLVVCNWNWSGDGNDNSSYITKMTPATYCGSINRNYQYHNTILAQCTGPLFVWAKTAWTRVGITSNYIRTVTCESEAGATVADISCPAPKPATICMAIINSGSCPS